VKDVATDYDRQSLANLHLLEELGPGRRHRAGRAGAADLREPRAGAAIVESDFSISENSRVASFQESFRSIAIDRAKMWIAIVFAIARSFASS
jgi:hypothetical protein